MGIGTSRARLTPIRLNSHALQMRGRTQDGSETLISCLLANAGAPGTQGAALICEAGQIA